MDAWSESISRSELNALYGITISDREWETLFDALDYAVHAAVQEILGSHDVG